MREAEISRLNHLANADIIVKDIIVSTGGEDQKQEPVPVLQATNLLGYIYNNQNLMQNNIDFFKDNQERKIHLVFVGFCVYFRILLKKCRNLDLQLMVTKSNCFTIVISNTLALALAIRHSQA